MFYCLLLLCDSLYNTAEKYYYFLFLLCTVTGLIYIYAIEIFVENFPHLLLIICNLNIKKNRFGILMLQI